jgi:NAD(P)-dependent dehydrogenase (short-subunit alcohol dehydrogenase family)
MPIAGARFEGRVALITGAGAGVGRATALRLADEGADIVAVDIKADAARETAELVAARGTGALAVTADVTDEAAVKAAAEQAAERFGRIDVLHNNAATLGPDTFGRDVGLVDLDVDVWDRTMAVNARGVMLCCKHVVPVMQAGGRGGAIVSTSSLSALTGDALRASYGSSKAAIGSLTRYVATMYGADGIRCNAVAPGLILTEIAYAQMTEDAMNQLAAERVLPRATTPEDIAGIVAFLASDDAAMITGQVLVADGGALAHRPLHAMRAWERQLREKEQLSG